jgi:hypothetical protein
MTFEDFDDLLDQSGRRPPTLRRRLLFIPLGMLFIIAAFLVTVPVDWSDPAAVVRAVAIALASSSWLWGWWELATSFRKWLRRHPGWGDVRFLAYLLGFAAYPALSIAVLFMASR